MDLYTAGSWDRPIPVFTACRLCSYTSTVYTIAASPLESPLVLQSLLESLLESLLDSLLETRLE
jgi:hypothetical protein